VTHTDDELQPDFSEVSLRLCQESQIDDEQYEDECYVKTHQPLSYGQHLQDWILQLCTAQYTQVTEMSRRTERTGNTKINQL